MKNIVANVQTGLTGGKYGKKPIIIGGIVIILIIIAIIIAGLVRAHRGPYDPKSDNYFDPSTFTETTVSIADADSNVDARIPVTGNADADKLLRSDSEAFIKSADDSYSGGKLSYSNTSHAFKKFLFVVLWDNGAASSNTKPYTVIGTTKGNAINYDKLFTAGYDGPIINSAAATLSDRFHVATQLGQGLVATALKNHDFRLASNGIVILVPTAQVPGAGVSVPYYEVLVPTHVFEQFINY